jgi:capsular polysaccharide biosynthesis protein
MKRGVLVYLLVLSAVAIGAMVSFFAIGPGLQ